MLKQSENINLNYAAKICRIDELIPIPKADRLMKARLGADTAVVSRDMKVGDVVFFVPCEACICEKYLGANNLFDAQNFEKNANHAERQKVLDEIFASTLKSTRSEDDIVHDQELEARAKSMVGFFNRYGRVRALKLRGEVSLGYVAPVSTLEIAFPELAGTKWLGLDGTQFDMVGDERFCWKYMPVMSKRPAEQSDSVPQHWWKKRQRKLKKFDRLVENQFNFHYDTGQLRDNLHILHPDDDITMTVKVHGTSVIISNLLVKRELTLMDRIKKFFGVEVPEIEYGNIYSSRKVIKNRYINKGQRRSFYGTDVHGCVNREFAGFLTPGMTVYGEIAGYEEGLNKYIQKDHDYGCSPGEWVFMPYRITETDQSGNVKEWEVQDVLNWTNSVKDEYIRSGGRANAIMPMTLLYHGKAGDLYDSYNRAVTDNLDGLKERYTAERLQFLESDAYNGYLPRRLETYEDYKDHMWRIKFLELMQADKDLIGMELREPMCRNKVPREGVVIRKDHDPKAEALKCKSKAHFLKECEAHDAGEVDMEEAEG